LATADRGCGFGPITAASAALGVIGFMKAGFGFRFAFAFLGAAFLVAFFGAAFLVVFFAAFFAVFFFAAMVNS
jgi:hypothetical protein